MNECRNKSIFWSMGLERARGEKRELESWRPGNSVEVWTCEGRGRHAASEYGDEEITWRRSLYIMWKKKTLISFFYQITGGHAGGRGINIIYMHTTCMYVMYAMYVYTHIIIHTYIKQVRSQQ